MFPVSRTLDRYDVSFDHDGLIANAGLIMAATLMSRFGLETLANRWVRTGSFLPGRKLCTLIAAMIAGATHIDHSLRRNDHHEHRLTRGGRLSTDE